MKACERLKYLNGLSSVLDRFGRDRIIERPVLAMVQDRGGWNSTELVKSGLSTVYVVQWEDYSRNNPQGGWVITQCYTLVPYDSAMGNLLHESEANQEALRESV